MDDYKGPTKKTADEKVSIGVMPIVYSVKKAAEVMGISASLLYTELQRNPAFPRKMIGARIVIPVKRLEQYLNQL